MVSVAAGVPQNLEAGGVVPAGHRCPRRRLLGRLFDAS